MATVDEKFLDEKLAELEKLRVWTPRLVSKLEAFLRSADDWALFRSNPFTFAEERGVDEDEAVDLFLLASKVGLLQMTWSLLCPGCGDAVQSFATLKSVCSVFHCHLCNTDIETCLDEYVHVGFTVSPRVRSIPAHQPETLSVEDFYFRYHFAREARGGPGGPRMVDIFPKMTRALSYIAPHDVLHFEVELELGFMAVYDIGSGAQFTLVISEGSKENPPLSLRLQDGAVPQAPIECTTGKLRLSVENDSAQRHSVMLLCKPQSMIDEITELMASGKATGITLDKFLSGRRLMTSQTFRQVFGSEVIRSSDGIGVRDVSILFTDLKGSTELYDRIGDLKAFALVNQHFERLGRAIARHRGAVIKTIGDAVMASFEKPTDAVLAARDMLREIEAFNHEVGDREIVLKVGVHRGASIAVTLNDRLDFFGQTVNIAARVQGLADADEIYLTDEVYREPGVREALAELHVTPRKATLKGVQRAINVYRAATEPSATSA